MSDRASDVLRSDMVRRVESAIINVSLSPTGHGGMLPRYPGSAQTGCANRLACRNHRYSDPAGPAAREASAPAETDRSATIENEIQQSLASVETQVSTCRGQVKALEDRKRVLDVNPHRSRPYPGQSGTSLQYRFDDSGDLLLSPMPCV